MDSTMGKNRFGMPLTLLIGVDNEGKSRIFALALTTDTKQSTYEWILDSFINYIRVFPKFIFIDEDESEIKGNWIFVF